MSKDYNKRGGNDGNEKSNRDGEEWDLFYWEITESCCGHITCQSAMIKVHANHGNKTLFQNKNYYYGGTKKNKFRITSGQM